MRIHIALAAFAILFGYAAFSSVEASDQAGANAVFQSAGQSAQARMPHRSTNGGTYGGANSGGLDPYTREVITRQYADFLLVDKSDRTLVAYSKGKPMRVFRGIMFGDAPKGHKQFEGDERTPEGLYFIDARNPESSFHLSLKISYPNAQDRAFAARYGRSAGGNIFIHGQPNGYNGAAIKRDWTDGCIALSNAEITELWNLVPDGTPIRIQP
ncbi:MAG: L,D-transpeptidase family protein [Pseudomonadota bacterium]